MNGSRRFWIFAVMAALISLVPGCAHDQALVSVQVQPTTETFGDANTPVSADAGLQVQLRALGSYIHPPVTKDITSQVTWASNDVQMVTVDANGMLTATGQACGNSLVSATVKTNTDGNRSANGAIVTGFMTANVVCPGAGSSVGPSITINFGGNGAGTVSSSPSGLGCSASCTGNFPLGSTVTLTAAPNGSTFGGWSGCDSVAGMVCTLNNLTSNKILTVVFN